MIIGSDQSEMPNYFTDITHLSVTLKDERTLDFIQENKFDSTNSMKTKTITRDSLMDIFHKMGSYDLFFMIISHVLKKASE